MRSGTTAFRRVMGSNPKISSLGEVFHSDFEDSPFTFYNYYLKQVDEHPDLSLPSLANREALLCGYFDHLNTILCIKEKEDRILLLGVNYNSLHSLNFFWQNPLSPPHMLSLFRKLETKVIHIRRINVLETLVSELRARRSGVWHIKAEAEQSPPVVWVNTGTLLAELEERTQETLLVRKWLASGKVLDLTYEEAFQPDNTVSRNVLQRSAAFLGVVDEFKVEVEYRRTRPPSLRQAISNYEAVAAVLSGTDFAKFLPGNGSVPDVV
jgi:hypothetical protein